MARLALSIFISLMFVGFSKADKSLVLHLTFDEDKGNTVTDYSEYNNNGTLIGTKP